MERVWGVGVKCSNRPNSFVGFDTSTGFGFKTDGNVKGKLVIKMLNSYPGLKKAIFW